MDMTRIEEALLKMAEGYNCAQSVFFSFCDDLHIDRNTALKMVTGLGAGMGRKEEVCGAVTGGIIVIGARYGRGEKDDKTATELTYRRTRDLMDRFAEKYGSYICRRLLHECDLNTEKGQKYFKDNDLAKKICVPCVQSVVEILQHMI